METEKGVASETRPVPLRGDGTSVREWVLGVILPRGAKRRGVLASHRDA